MNTSSFDPRVFALSSFPASARRALRVVPGLVVLGALLGARDARACSPVPCSGASIAPRAAAAVIPEGAAGLVVRRSDRDADTVLPTPTLRTKRGVAPGTDVPFSLQPLAGGSYLVVPSAPLAKGSYELAMEYACFSADDKSKLESTFDVVDAAPLPTHAGSLAAGASVVEGADVDAQGGMCGPTHRTAQASIEIRPDASLAPWLALARKTVFVDGVAYQGAEYGALAEPYGRTVVLSAICNPARRGSSLAPGRHHVEVEIDLAGVPRPLPRIAADVDLACDTAPGDLETPGSAQGCSIVAAPAAEGTAGAVLAGIFAAVARLRRRRRSGS